MEEVTSDMGINKSALFELLLLPKIRINGAHLDFLDGYRTSVRTYYLLVFTKHASFGAFERLVAALEALRMFDAKLLAKRQTVNIEGI